MSNATKGKIRRVGVILLVFLLQACFIAPVKGESVQNSSNIDAMLVLDASGSMKTSDPEQISTEAVKMFIDMCHVSGDKAGIVAYSDGVVKEMKLKAMNSLDDKQELKNAATGIAFGQWTDIGAGLKRAIQLLDNGREPTHKPLIILLSDGRSDPGRNKALADQDKAAALNSAKEKGYPIYTIGLNADGSVDRGELENISGETGAKNFITDTANDLPKILREIFADHLKLKVMPAGSIQGNGEYQDVKINIPNANVVEANISMLSANPVQIRLSNPNGKEVEIPSKDIYFTASRKYSMLKLVNPTQGDWLLKVKGISGDKVEINLVFNYDLQAEMALSPDSGLHKGDKVSITSCLTSNGQKVQDEDLYKGMSAKLVVTNLSDSKVQESSLVYKDISFKGEYTVPGNGKYQLKVQIDGPSFYRESQAVIIDIQNRKPVIVNPIKDQKLTTGRVEKIDLRNVFNDPDGDPLTYTVTVGNSKRVSADIKGDSLNISTKEAGNTQISVNVNDGRGGTATLTFSVKVISLFGIILALTLILAAVIGLILLAMLMRRRNRSFVGEVMLEIVDSETGDSSEYRPQYRRLDTYKGQVSLYQLLELLAEFKEAEKVLFIPGEHDTLELRNKSQCVVQRTGRTVDASKGFTLKGGDRISIQLSHVSKTIILEYLTH